MLKPLLPLLSLALLLRALAWKPLSLPLLQPLLLHCRCCFCSYGSLGFSELL
jgi:hypothetical protein